MSTSSTLQSQVRRSEQVFPRGALLVRTERHCRKRFEPASRRKYSSVLVPFGPAKRQCPSWPNYTPLQNLPGSFQTPLRSWPPAQQSLRPHQRDAPHHRSGKVALAEKTIDRLFQCESACEREAKREPHKRAQRRARTTCRTQPRIETKLSRRRFPSTPAANARCGSRCSHCQTHHPCADRAF